MDDWLFYSLIVIGGACVLALFWWLHRQKADDDHESEFDHPHIRY